ncbi:MAG: ribosomal protection-like ABC-F family protein [Myxococcota bacterium]
MRLEGIEKRFGDRVLFQGVSFDVRSGDRIGLVGPNGAGKTTLLRIAAGVEPPDGGRRLLARGTSVAMLRQEIDPTLERSVREEASSAFAALDAVEAELRELEQRMSELGGRGEGVPAALAERYDHQRTQFEQEGGFDREARVERTLAGLGFDEADRERPLSSFSGGWLMRVELAKLLLAEPEVLLLDEPTNHLDLPSIQWFEQTLEEFRGAVLVVSHDRTFLRRHARSIAGLERGGFSLTQGGWDRYLQEREERRTQAEARRRVQQRQVAETERFIQRFRAKASKARQVQSRVKALARMERVEVASDARRRIRMRIPPVARAGEVVLRLEGVHKRYEDTAVYRGVDLEVRRGDKVALAGPNGAGKSTLLRIAAGALAFEQGERILGHNVSCSFFAQHQLEVLRGEASVLEELEALARTDDLPRLRSHLGAFLFSGDDVEKKVSVLSGGEKSRLALARLLLHPANLLVLDEPTNHLDVDACEILEEALRGYGGTLLFISHDRSFINALATRVVEVRQGRLREFHGNYDDYLRDAGDGSAAGGSVPGHGRRRAPGAGAEGGTAAPAGDRRETRRRDREHRRQRERLARQIERLEAEILEREKAVEALRWRRGDPEVHRDAERARALEAEGVALDAAIRELYRGWEALAAELEALECEDAEGSG